MPGKPRGSTPPTSPKPFAAARPTVASLQKQRAPIQPIKNKSPGRSLSDNREVPDVAARRKDPSPSSRQSPPKQVATRKSDVAEKPAGQKPRWVTVVRPPAILPLPAPPVKKPKAHEVFERKVRKVLPQNKILQGSPRNVYVPIEKVGTGANGAVVSATNRKKRSLVAIKRSYIEDDDLQHHAYVLRELRIMGCLSHPNIISLSEACVWGDNLWMSMELMTCSVFGLLYNLSVGLPENYALWVVQAVLEGLVFLHNHNYIHRDVKCENILLDRDGQVKLGDFGLATPLNKINTAQLGTAKWMAPEVAAECSYTETVDVWSLGITIIEMMDRVPPLYYLDGSREIFEQIIHGPPPNFSFAIPSPSMAGIIRLLLNPVGNRRKGAKCMLTLIRREIEGGFLSCVHQTEFAALVQQAFPDQK